MSIIATREPAPRLPALGGKRPLMPGAASHGMTMRDVLRIIRKRKWLILVAFLTWSSLAVAATVVWLSFWPLYRAEAYLVVAPPPTTFFTAGGSAVYGQEIINRYKRSQAALVKNKLVLTEAAKDRRITGTAWYRNHEGQILQALEANIDVSVVPETDYVKLAMLDTSQKEMADIINALADAFVKWSGESPKHGREEELRKLNGTRTDMQTKLETIRRQIATSRGGSAMAAMRERFSLVAVKLQMYQQQLSEAEMKQTNAEAAWNAFKGELDKFEKGELTSMEGDPQILQFVDMDTTYRQMVNQKADIAIRLAQAQDKHGEGHPSVQALQAILKSVSAQEEATRKDLIGKAAKAMGQSLKNNLAQATAAAADLNERLNLVKTEARDLEENVGRIEVLDREAKYLEENITKIDQRVLDLTLLITKGGVAGESSDIGPVSIGAYAQQPLEPDQPQWKIMVPIGALLGLVTGFGLAFLLELTDTSVKTPSDISRRVDLPLLGMVPHADDLEEDVADFRRVTLLAPNSPAAEAFRQIRTNLLFSTTSEGRRSLLVTSPAPEDGRTTVVINLATAIAQAGKKVLIVDANFRQPALGQIFPQAPAAGLSSALVGQANWRDVVGASDVPNLSVIAAGPLPPNPAELLGSEALRQMIQEMTAEYEQVIFDGAPVLVVTDASVLSRQVDGVVLVIRAGVNTAGIVQRSAELLTRLGAHNLGVILQGVRSTAGGYLRKNYETFYEYHQKALP
jgi:capsular exopolysaccharide synthesis family protein